MNCNPGNLAYIAKNIEGNARHFVYIEFDSGHRDSGEHWWVCTCAQDLRSWHDGLIKAGQRILIADCDLRPIRDPGEYAIDEMVLIAGKPQEVTA